MAAKNAVMHYTPDEHSTRSACGHYSPPLWSGDPKITTCATCMKKSVYRNDLGIALHGVAIPFTVTPDVIAYAKFVGKIAKEKAKSSNACEEYDRIIGHLNKRLPEEVRLPVLKSKYVFAITPVFGTTFEIAVLADDLDEAEEIVDTEIDDSTILENASFVFVREES